MGTIENNQSAQWERNEAEHFKSKKLLIKIGSEAITGGNSNVDKEFMNSVANQVGILFRSGVQVQIVTSGAVACGRKYIQNFNTIRDKQMAAAAGQGDLIRAWKEVFEPWGIPIFQVLVTQNTLHHATEILASMMEIGISIINENDVISMYEMSMLGKRADNDTSAGLIAQKSGVDTVLLLTNTAVLDRNGGIVHSISPIYFSDMNVEFTGSSTLGTGGMASKHEVAMSLALSGIRTIIGDAREDDIILNGARGLSVGTTYEL